MSIVSLYFDGEFQQLVFSSNKSIIPIHCQGLRVPGFKDRIQMIYNKAAGCIKTYPQRLSGYH